MRIILPMAGHGKRFREVGYADEKPLIRVGGKTLLEWSLECVPKKWERIGVLRTEQRSQQLTDLFFREQVSVPHLMYLPGSTTGAALTVLAAAVGLPPEEPVAVMNCDQWFVCDLAAITAHALERKWDGYILTFDGTGSQWSYVCMGGERRVMAVVEKPPKPEPTWEPTVGFYWWRRAGTLVRSICRMIAHRASVKGEYYVAPAYNHLDDPALGEARVFAVRVAHFRGLGTPEQVQAFEAAALVREP